MSTCCSWLLINYISAHCLLLWFHLISWNTLSVVFHTQHTWGTWSISTLYTHEISAPGMLRPLCCGWVVVDDDDNVTLDDLSANLINCLILLHLLPWIPFNLSLNSIKLFAHNFHNFSICLLNAANMILIGSSPLFRSNCKDASICLPPLPSHTVWDKLKCLASDAYHAQANPRIHCAGSNAKATRSSSPCFSRGTIVDKVGHAFQQFIRPPPTNPAVRIIILLAFQPYFPRNKIESDYLMMRKFT